MAPLHELIIVDHPEGAKVVLVSDEALVQTQVGPDGVLYTFEWSPLKEDEEWEEADSNLQHHHETGEEGKRKRRRSVNKND